MFFEPEKEILVVHRAEEIVSRLRTIGDEQVSRIGQAMRMRALAAHTYALRAQQVQVILASAIRADSQAAA